jgi:hypothetical protein
MGPWWNHNIEYRQGCLSASGQAGDDGEASGLGDVRSHDVHGRT